MINSHGYLIRVCQIEAKGELTVVLQEQGGARWLHGICWEC